MRISGSVTNYYVYGGGLLYQVTETPTTSTMLTYHFDIRGSTIATTDSGGYVKDQVQYSPYGLVIARAGTNDLPFLYNGRFGVITDPSGLMCMRARYYNPYMCRFVNPDPSGFTGGLNWYCFADGNPICKTDPMGLQSWMSPGYGSMPNPVNIVPANMIATRPDPSAYFVQGLAIGAVGAGVVVVAAPVAVTGLTALGLSSTAAAATVTVGVGATSVIGTSQVAGDMAGSWGQNWNQVTYDAGLLTGGFAVGAAGAGRALGQNISGQPSSLPTSLWPFSDTKLGYDPNFQNGSLLNWLGSAPTPSSGGAVIGLTSAGAASFLQQSQSPPGSWLSPATGSSQNQSSPTGK